MFKIYKIEVENQVIKKISDIGGEYEFSAFYKFCAENGILHQTTAPYTPQKNDYAEQKKSNVQGYDKF